MKTIEQTKKYRSVLSEYQTEKAIASVKSIFAESLSKSLNLLKVEAPLMVQHGTGINDDLNGTEHPVTVKIKQMPVVPVEIVHSLAKWKRSKLAKLKAKPGEGIITDMKALRPDEDLSDIHSVLVDQWDWEQVILESNRTIEFLKKTVSSIYASILETQLKLAVVYPELLAFLPKEISFIHTEELLKLYPDLSPKQREDAIAKQKGAVFIIGIGAKLSDGKKHDGRAPDYDDWITETEDGRKGLNGDLVVWNPVLKRSFEVSSMGIRVSSGSLKKQLNIEGKEERLGYTWHQQLINGALPYTIGGGIGQSRLAMLLLQKKHIAEVQSSVWPEEIVLSLIQQQINIL